MADAAATNRLGGSSELNKGTNVGVRESDSDWIEAPMEEDVVGESDRDNFTEKQAPETSPENADTLEIEYRYFTFETHLPPPNTVVLASRRDGAATAAPPPPPDLKPYVDPHLWPEGRKNLMLLLSCIATCLTAYSAGSFSPPAERMASAFGVSLVKILAAGITLFCIGFALAPMLLAPLSETNGRYPVFVVSGIVCVIFHVVCGASPDYAAILISRLMVGIGNSVFSTMIGGVIADMWHAEGRNTPMALFSGAVFLGTGLGPLVCAVITYRTTAPYNSHDVSTDNSLMAPWRWVFWHQAISNGLLVLALAILFRESRGSVLLSRKAAALNAWYEGLERSGYYGVWVRRAADDEDQGSKHVAGGPHSNVEMQLVAEPLESGDGGQAGSDPGSRRLHRIRWLVKDDENRTTIIHMISVSLYRPFHMLVTEPVVFFFSLWVAFAWAVLYLHFGSIFLIFEDTYSWNVEKAGRAFSGMMVGSVVATAMGLMQDKILRGLVPRRWRHLLRADVPECRLYAACFSSILLPAGIFIFGYSARADVHWIAPVIGIAVSTCGILSVYLATFNYLADVYHRFASSALAAQSCCRNILGGIFPLVMRPLYVNMGTTRATAILGSVAFGLTLVPWVLSIFGERIRRRSKFAMSLDH